MHMSKRNLHKNYEKLLVKTHNLYTPIINFDRGLNIEIQCIFKNNLQSKMNRKK